MSIYVGVSGVVKKLKTPLCGVGGAINNIKHLYASIGGSRKTIYTAASDGEIESFIMFPCHYAYFLADSWTSCTKDDFSNYGDIYHSEASDGYRVYVKQKLTSSSSQRGSIVGFAFGVKIKCIDAAFYTDNTDRFTSGTPFNFVIKNVSTNGTTGSMGFSVQANGDISKTLAINDSKTITSVTSFTNSSIIYGRNMILMTVVGTSSSASAFGVPTFLIPKTIKFNSVSYPLAPYNIDPLP